MNLQNGTADWNFDHRFLDKYKHQQTKTQLLSNDRLLDLGVSKKVPELHFFFVAERDSCVTFLCY